MNKKMKNSGIVDLPLHGGKCPQWLFPLMKKLAGNIIELITDEYGEDEFLKRLSDPLWFQAFGCSLGFDWHSSGLTTTTTGAIKEALMRNNLGESLGIAVAGGKGKTSRKTPDEIIGFGDKLGINESKINSMTRASRLSAKVDNSLIQDGFTLYHHCFFFTKKSWAIVQQGMNETLARRYHWISKDLKSFVNEPHSGIISDKITKPFNLVDKDINETRKCSIELIKENPKKLEKYFKIEKKQEPKTLSYCSCNKQSTLNDFFMPSNKFKKIEDENKNIIKFSKEHFPKVNFDMKVMINAYEEQPENYEELVLIKGMGAKNIRALAMISHLSYGTPISWKDPVKFSFTHGGKDGWPYPVDKEMFNESILFLKNAIKDSKTGNREKIYSLKRLNNFYSNKISMM